MLAWAWSVAWSCRGEAGGDLVHPLRFFVHPQVAPDAAFARSVLPKYVADLNQILAKNTRRRFSFDPETGFVPTETKPQTDSYFDLPTAGYEVWAHIDVSGNGFSWGGYLSADMSGAAALAGIHWPRLYDPEDLADQDAVRDYWRQINVILHEFGHVFGAGGAEYYAVLTPDDTGEAPLSEISLLDPDNAYFRARPDLRSDPMLTMPSLATRAEYLEAVRYSDLTAATMNGTYRWPLVRAPIPDLARLRVHLRHRDDGTPVAGARVRAWRVHTGNPVLETKLLSEAASDGDGSVTWSWEAESVDSITTDSIRMLKIAKDGYRPVGHPVTWIDLSAAAVLHGQAVMEEVVLMDSERLRLRWKSPGVLRVTGGSPDTRFVVERASDLRTWTAGLTGHLTEGAFEAEVAPSDSGGSWFYRARELEAGE